MSELAFLDRQIEQYEKIVADLREKYPDEEQMPLRLFEALGNLTVHKQARDRLLAIPPGWGHREENASLLAYPGGCPACGATTEDGHHRPGCDQERCEHDCQMICCDKSHQEP